MIKKIIGNRILISLVVAVSILSIGIIIQAFNLKSLKNSLEEQEILYKNKIKELENQIIMTTEEKNKLGGELNLEKEKTLGYEKTIEEITEDVEKLTKLTETDKELLQKYSKVYFLNENYTPKELTEIENKYKANKEKDLFFHKNAYPFLTKMLEKAKEDGVEILINSAFRSFKEQTSLKSSYSVKYGTGANQFSADQGYSEHQLGTALDFSSPEIKNLISNDFEKTKAYDWLLKNAHNFGFILSYPKGNNFYVFEPWHWRFVGVRLAQKLERKGLFFYDLDQREIDNYLVRIFD